MDTSNWIITRRIVCRYNEQTTVGMNLKVYDTGFKLINELDFVINHRYIIWFFFYQNAN